MTKLKLLFRNRILYMLLVILTIGCEKGEEGAPGKAGNTNVIGRMFEVQNWTYGSPNYYTNLYVPELTAENIDSAAVLVYFSFEDNSWIALPYTQYNFPDNYYMNFNTSIGNVQINWFYDSSLSSGDDPNTYYGKTLKYKVVIIPPYTQRLYPNINYQNYKQVEAAFNIQ